MDAMSPNTLKQYYDLLEGTLSTICLILPHNCTVWHLIGSKNSKGSDCLTSRIIHKAPITDDAETTGTLCNEKIK